MNIELNILLQYAPTWASGVAWTLLLSFVAIALGTALALLLFIGQVSPFRFIQLVCRVYIDLFRAIPALVLIGTLFFLVPSATGIRISPFLTAAIALSLNLAPFASECIRAGFESVPTIQFDSARSLGFHGWKLHYYIIAPQAVRRILPSLVGQYVTTVKLTSLAATIGVPEIWNATGRIVTDTSLPVEARIGGAALYVAILVPMLWLVMWLEHFFNVKGLGQAES